MKKLKKQKEEGKLYAGICSAPALVFKTHDLLDCVATCHPMRENIMGSFFTNERVVVNKNCVTSQSPGTAIEFALTLLELLQNEKKAKNIANQILYKNN